MKMAEKKFCKRKKNPTCPLLFYFAFSLNEESSVLNFVSRYISVIKDFFWLQRDPNFKLYINYWTD